MAETPELDRSNLFFEVGVEYRDTGSPNKSEDQFLRWINIPGSGMKNMGGIRWLKTKSKKRQNSDGIVLVSSHLNTDSHNPWDDIVDFHLGSVRYWGDAKFHQKKGIDDFEGNKNLRRAIDESDRSRHPFILHFSKTRSGWMRFNGLCVLNSLDLAWFQDLGRPVQNYRATLSILDCKRVSVDWITRWRTEDKLSVRLEGAPEAWDNYIRGKKVNVMRAWSGKILSTKEQLPPPGSPEEKALEQLHGMDPFAFEAMVVSLIGNVGAEIVRDLKKTRDRRDGGFDFVGTFIIPEPFKFEINFKGEVKRHRNTISPNHVSRLVARLDRGEYGIYVTTSAFSKQAQEEVYEMRYPVSLVHSRKLISMIKNTRYWSDIGIDKKWLSSFEEIGKEEE